MDDNNKIKSELERVGIHIESIYDLVNNSHKYAKGIPVLLGLLKTGVIKNDKSKEGIIRALAVKEAKGFATPVLINEYKNTAKDKQLLRWIIGNTVSIVATDNSMNDIINIIQDKTNGISRQMFVSALSNMASDKIEDVLISFLNDDEVASHAIEALSKMNSNKALPEIQKLLNHSKPLIRKEARKALKKLGKSII